jgi:siroheme synthase (precorrin-2 oxidase/ferrochelatase)
MYKRILIFATLMGAWMTSYTQINGIYETPEISKMMDHYIKLNKSIDEIDGWRIQIVTTTDRREMDQAISKFRRKYPEQLINWTHKSPYYHVKVGAYMTKRELQGFLITLKQDFPSAIAVREKIEKTDLL